MTRRARAPLLSNEEQSLQDVWRWYEFQRALVGEEKGRVLDALSTGVSLAMSRYVGKTREELDDDFAYQTAELAKVTMLGMLACIEAILRVDFIERVWNKKKDGVSRRFRHVCRRRGIEKIRLEEDILDTWRAHGPHAGTRHAVAEFKFRRKGAFPWPPNDAAPG
jgi:hypothetical protein